MSSRLMNLLENRYSPQLVSETPVQEGEERPVLNSGFYDEPNEVPLVEYDFNTGEMVPTSEENVAELMSMVGFTGGDDNG